MRFPRSVEHCLAEMGECLKQMPKSQQLQQMVALLKHKISQHQTDNLDAVALHEYLDLLQCDLGEVHNALIQNYFHAYQEAVPKSLPTQREMGFAEQ
jgi:uncharacterized alpha-E superfamily protein